MLFADTDSPTNEIKSKDVCENFFKHKDLFDLSNYTNDSKFFDTVNERVIRKMKDKFKGIPINKFIESKSRMYCIVSDDDTEVNTAKGVNTSIEFNEYKDVLFNEKIIRHKMKRIQSKKRHKISTYDVNKISLSCFDDKRYISNDGITTLAYFHKDLKD